MKKSTELNIQVKAVKAVKRKEAKNRKREAEKIADELYDKILVLAKESAEQGESKCNFSQELFPDLHKSVHISEILQKKLRKEGIILHFENNVYILNFQKWYKRIGGHLLSLICNGILFAVTYNPGYPANIILFSLYIAMVLGVVLVIYSEYFIVPLEYKDISEIITVCASGTLLCSSLFRLICLLIYPSSP